ncbi:hypothetical protein CPRO_26440 [Anaerotignum propionicum DSM 1682]|jgi:hypothetical protein|uniref:Uncharacterized protein n=1 Tax=Anaerotignum propionicum DSM 1682 TaxID=991789 RepID=A0ABN4LFC8_ANAPI|nr:hypothetical protein CPRO_26440 [Anaerotignum propionicum DSM 1682]
MENPSIGIAPRARAKGVKETIGFWRRINV